MDQKGLTFKIFIFLVLNDFLETGAQSLFKTAAVSQENFHISQGHDVLIFIGHMITFPLVWLGLLAVVLIFTSWSTILSRIDLSMATPIASFSYVLVAVAAVVFFHEHVGWLRWTGILFILAGVSLVSTSAPKKQDLN